MGNFRDLIAWQRGQDLAEAIYRVTAAFPPSERFGLTAQLRRAAASVPANLAEGCGRGSSAAFRAFVRIARGSLWEVESHLLLAHRLGLVSVEATDEVQRLIQAVARPLNGLLQSRK